MKTARVTGAFGLTMLASSLGLAQELDEYGEVEQTVARISHVAGEVSVARAEDPDDWQALELNVPVTLGDHIFVEPRSRVELEVGGTLWLRLGSRSDLSVLDLREKSKQLSLKSGTLSVQLRELDSGESIEIDTPNAAFEILQPGEYRIEVDDEGNSALNVREGRAMVAAGGGETPVEAGHRIEVEGDAPFYEITRLGPMDGWDRWVAGRIARLDGRLSQDFASGSVVGLRDLDDYGAWDDVPEYGRVWVPAVEVGWVPFRHGRWIWQSPWGWTWVSYEPWGWAPYHYGRWVFASSRWCWVPTGRHEHRARYRPAIVGFVWGDGFVAWFPLGPADPFFPWWGTHRHAPQPHQHFTHRHQVSVVSRQAFESGARVHEAQVQDAARVREASTAPVLGGRVPVEPTKLALRLSEKPPRARPAAASDRAVVVKKAPPAPSTFQSRSPVIRDPTNPTESRDKETPALRVKPAKPASGDVTLSPRKLTKPRPPRDELIEEPTPAPRDTPPARKDRDRDRKTEERGGGGAGGDRDSRPSLRAPEPRREPPEAVEPAPRTRTKPPPGPRMDRPSKDRDAGSGESENRDQPPGWAPSVPPAPPPPTLIPQKKAPKKKGERK